MNAIEEMARIEDGHLRTTYDRLPRWILRNLLGLRLWNFITLAI